MSRKLDAEVAEKVMGWEPRYSVADDANDRWVVRNGSGKGAIYSLTYLMDHWQPSTDLGAAWEVVEKMATLSDPWMLTLKNWNYYGDRTCTAEFVSHPLGPPSVEIRAATVPEAICLAALKAISLVGAPSPWEGA